MRTWLMLMMGFALALGAAAAPETRVNPRLDELLSRMNLNHPGLEKVKNAKTPLEKQAALLEYYQKRQHPSDLEVDNPQDPPNDKRHKEIAEEAIKHIFPGQPVYPSQPRGENIDWDTNPFPDKEWLWQFHRFGWWRPMGRTYLATRDERYAKEWMHEINSWVDHMHNAKNYRNHPGWRSLEVGIRMLVWAQGFERFIQSPSLDGYTLVNFLYSLDRHADQIDGMYPPRGKEPASVGNFDITQQIGLLTIAAVFPEFKESTGNAQRAVERLVRFQQTVMLPDGVINEYVPSYHMGYPHQFTKAKQLCEKFKIKAQFPKEYNDLIEKGITAVLVWSHPDATSPLFGDAWLGKPDGNRRWMAKFLQDFNRPDWEYFVTNGKSGKAPTEKIMQLPVAGYTSIRSGWNDQAVFLVTKNTDLVRHQWHNHTDNLSFELSAYGRRFMTDASCYNYSGEPEWRLWFRRPQTHQMITIDDAPVASRGKTVMTKSVPGLDVAVLENQAAKDFTHRRSFMLVDNAYIVLLDEVKGAATGTVRQHLQLDPAPVQIDAGRKTVRTMHADGPNLVVKSGDNAAKVTLQEEEGWWSPRYMFKEPRPAFAFIQEKTGDKPVYFLTLLAPLPKVRQLNEAKLCFLKDGKPTTEPTNEIYLRINLDTHYRIKLDPAKGEASLAKAVNRVADRVEGNVNTSGEYREPAVPDFNKPAVVSGNSGTLLRLNIFNAKGSKVVLTQQQAADGGQVAPITWGSAEYRKLGTIMQSSPLGAKFAPREFSLVPEADGTLQVGLLGNDLKGAGGKRVPLWVEFKNVTFDGAVNAAELAREGVKPQQAWHDAPKVFAVKVKKGQKLTIKCEVRAIEKK